jgi:hypothetical protein
MFRKTGEKMSVPKTLLLVVLVAVLLISAVSITRAAEPGAHAFGKEHWETDLKGHEVYVWTGIPPDTEFWTAAPLGICQYCPCVSGVRKVETGWIKGTGWDLGDVLQQYVVYTDIDGKLKKRFHLGNLSDNTWYQFKVMYSQSADRWEAWRFNDVVWFEPHDLGWAIGCRLVAGSENADADHWMDAYGWHPEHRKWGGSWTLYNYTVSDTIGGGDIYQVYDFGYRAWGRAP